MIFLQCFLELDSLFYCKSFNIVFGTNHFWLNCLFNRCPLINSSSSVFDQHPHRIVLMTTLIQQLRKTNRCVSVLFPCEQTMYLWPGVVQMKHAIFHLGQCGHGRPWHGIRVWFLFRHTDSSCASDDRCIPFTQPPPAPITSRLSFVEL